MSASRRARVVSVGLLALIFLGGVLTGYAADAFVDDRGAGPEREREDERQAWVIEQVGLTADQRAEVDSIVEHYRGEMAGVVEEYRERYRELVAQTRGDIEQVLTPEQREEYRALLERRESGKEDGETAGAAADPER